MNYEIIVRPKAEKYILRLRDPDYEAIVESLESLSALPRPHAAIKLVESSLWRLRVRDFRIIYSIDDNERIIRVVKVSRRSEDTYKGL